MRISYTIRKHPLINSGSNTKYPMGYNTKKKQPDERFPQRNTKDMRDNKRDDDSGYYINNRDIKDTVRMRTFSRTTKYILVTA